MIIHCGTSILATVAIPARNGVTLMVRFIAGAETWCGRPRRSGHSRGAERVVSRCAEQILKLAAADAGIAALDDRVGEGLGQVSHQREVVVVGLDADDVHESADDLDSHLRAEDLRMQS